MKSLKYIIAGFCLAALPGMEAMARGGQSGRPLEGLS